MGIKRGLVGICIPAVLCSCISFGQGATQSGTTPASGTTTFALPPAKRISIEKTVDCTAIATSFTSETGKRLETEVTVGTDHLTLTRRSKMLRVTVHHKAGDTDDFDT